MNKKKVVCFVAVLRLLYYDLRSFIKNQLNILLILIIGIAVSSFSLCFYYCTAVTDAEEAFRFEAGPREVKVIFSKEVDHQSFSGWINERKPDVEEINLLDYNALLRCLSNFHPDSESTIPDALGIVGRYTTKSPNLKSGRWFDDHDKTGNTIVINHGITIPDGGDTLTIEGSEYHVIGTIGDSVYTNCVFMNIDSFLIANKGISALTFTLNDTPNEEQLDMIEHELRQLDESLSFYPPSVGNYKTDVVRSFLQSLTLPILIILFSFVCIFSLYRFWLVHIRKIHAIYKICGVRISIFAIYLILEVAVLTATGFAIGTAIFYLIYTLGNPTELLRGPNIAELLILYVVSLVISLLASLPSIIRAVKLSPVDMKEGRK